MQIRGTGKLISASHTGKIRHHKHTSYGSLAAILLLTLVPVFQASHAVASAAAVDPTQPVTGNYQTFAVVPGQKPTTAPSIDNIVNGHVYNTGDPVVVRGGCPPNTLVKLFKNGVFAGAVLCQSGNYQLSIDLFVGDNSLVARAYNTNDEPSPDSLPVSVRLVLAGVAYSSTDQLNIQGAPAGQFYMTSQMFYRGAKTGESLSWPLILAGGKLPYAVSISWGDGKTELISRADASQFDISHVYDKAGGYRGGYTIIVKAADQAGSTTYLQLVAIVSSAKPLVGVVAGVTGGYGTSAVVRTAWQMLGVAVIVVLSFWLGEKRQTKLTRRAGLLTA